MTDTAIPAERYVGASVKRSEDPRILTGRGRYIDDVRLPGMLHAARGATAPQPRARSPAPSTRFAAQHPRRTRCMAKYGRSASKNVGCSEWATSRRPAASVASSNVPSPRLRQ